ncbi:MAG: class I SAM-dependent methyltransferase [Candidatus Dormibacteria bacterium]
MNRYHQRLCRSPRWADFVTGELLPEILQGVELGPRALELGPGYGASTRGLLGRVSELVALESDPELVRRLQRELGASVTVVLGDATQMPFASSSFSAVVCFTMLHHLRSRRAQDRLFGEVARVLEPGGLFVARDSSGGWRFRLIHLGDVFTPVDSRDLDQRLVRAGLESVEITATPWSVEIRARRPEPSDRVLQGSSNAMAGGES